MKILICYEDPFTEGQVLCAGVSWGKTAAATAVVNCLSCITYHNNINSHRARFNICSPRDITLLKGARAVIQRNLGWRA